MNARPYQSFNMDELRETIRRFWNSAGSLQVIADELSFRPKLSASRLRNKVEQRISELAQDGNPYDNYQPEHHGAESLFAQVGLHPSAPDFVIEAVRKAYRMHYHPDKYSSNEKKAAEETFKEVDKIFDRIKELKG